MQLRFETAESEEPEMETRLRYQVARHRREMTIGIARLYV
jgi:hypothetical protein